MVQLGKLSEKHQRRESFIDVEKRVFFIAVLYISSERFHMATNCTAFSPF
jgi:hypothetical protein